MYTICAKERCWCFLWLASIPLFPFKELPLPHYGNNWCEANSSVAPWINRERSIFKLDQLQVFPWNLDSGASIPGRSKVSEALIAALATWHGAVRAAVVASWPGVSTSENHCASRFLLLGNWHVLNSCSFPSLVLQEKSVFQEGKTGQEFQISEWSQARWKVFLKFAN